MSNCPGDVFSISKNGSQDYPQYEFNMLNPALRRATRVGSADREIQLGADLLGVVLKGTHKQTVRILLDTGSSNSIILNDFASDVTPTVNSE